MCGCGRKVPEVITSAQAQADMDARASEDAAIVAAQAVLSAQNATANASAGWVVYDDAETPSQV